MQQDLSQSHLRNAQIAYLAINQLIPDPKNARQHPVKHVRQLAKSITTFGFNVPILIDNDRQVIAGHGRLLAAQHLGWTEVPTITLSHLTPDQLRAFAIADNRLTEISEWDDRLLAEQLKALSEVDLGFDLDVIGFELPEIDLRIQGLNSDAEEDFSEEELSEGPIVSQPGDLWALGPHRLYCGNALEAESYAILMAGATAAAVFSDLPIT